MIAGILAAARMPRGTGSAAAGRRARTERESGKALLHRRRARRAFDKVRRSIEPAARERAAAPRAIRPRGHRPSSPLLEKPKRGSHHPVRPESCGASIVPCPPRPRRPPRARGTASSPSGSRCRLSIDPDGTGRSSRSRSRSRPRRQGAVASGPSPRYLTGQARASSRCEGPMREVRGPVVRVIVVASLVAPSWAGTPPAGTGGETRPRPGHLEVPVPPPETPPPPRSERTTSAAAQVTRGNFTSVQVNVDAAGNNIVGDAANEPSIAIDPTDPNNIVIGWRQFDDVGSSFRQAGYAYSHDGGKTWTFPGVLEPGQFRSDPVLDADSNGVFYYYSLSSTTNAEMFISRDKGVTWEGPIPAQGGDKNWLTVDTTGLPSDGFLYPIWNSQFTCCAPGTDHGRSIDGGYTYQGPWASPVNFRPKWGTIAVGPDAEVYFTGANLSATGHVILRSDSLKDGTNGSPKFELAKSIDLGGTTSSGGTPNPGGLLGQVWVAVDRSNGPSRGYVYVLASVDPPGADPMSVHLVRSTDGGQTWSAPIQVDDDPTGTSYQWFGTLSVAPDGRLDVVWNDTRSDPSGVISELYYAYSTDHGETWSAGIPVSPAFDSTIGHPQQNKIGDYYHMRSDADGAAVAYAATFNGEQDVYFLRVGDCNANGAHDSLDVGPGGNSADCNANGIPDECEPDCNGNGIADGCDLSSGTSFDCNLNFVPDECDISSGDSADCNSDGRPDECDVTLDVETDEGWTVGDPSDTATTGIWERVDPIGTEAQPEDDHTPNGVYCWVTGQGSPGGSIGENDVDDGRTTLFSPVFDLSGMSDPTIGYWRWYSNDKGSSPGEDVFTVDVSNDGGATWVNVETVGPTGPDTVGGWIYHSFRVADFVTPTANVRLRFIAADEGAGSIVEAAVDDVTVIDCSACGAAVPSEGTGLMLSRSSGTVADLSWDPIPGADTYNVYRGSSPDATDLACFQNGIPTTSTQDDGALPPPGGSFFHVVTGRNCAGESPLGAGRTPVSACP
ncbi:MAG: exo-alpha-sialidase [Acidobacteria bacterium]|nr:MAG: exo-alpha-sialidase [Acidobacteriota bacterium]